MYGARGRVRSVESAAGTARPPLGEQLTAVLVPAFHQLRELGAEERDELLRFDDAVPGGIIRSRQRDPSARVSPDARGRPSAACRPSTTCRRRSGSGPGWPADAAAHDVELDQVADSSGNRSRAHLQLCRRVIDRRCCCSCRRRGGRPERPRHRMTTIWEGSVPTAGRIPPRSTGGRIPAQMGEFSRPPAPPVWPPWPAGGRPDRSARGCGGRGRRARCRSRTARGSAAS